MESGARSFGLPSGVTDAGCCRGAVLDPVGAGAWFMTLRSATEIVSSARLPTLLSTVFTALVARTAPLDADAGCCVSGSPANNVGGATKGLGDGVGYGVGVGAMLDVSVAR